MRIPLDGVKDPATKTALRQVEDALRSLNQRVAVRGATDSEKLTSLIAALEQLGLISDQTE